uniref:tetratricopeptide repeat protein n=1 Tax=Helicobacter bizzozeronii TaxID=56877 RepID=UPI003988FB00
MCFYAPKIPQTNNPPTTPKPTNPKANNNPPAVAQEALSAGISAIKVGDYRSAFKLFAKSCDQGNPAGCFAVGTMYDNGVGIQRDPEKATRYYEMGCSGGDASECA